jgi:hypothetical protein
MRSALVAFALLGACQTERAELRKEPSPLGPPLSGTLPKQMRNCPSAVPTADTAATPTDEGVDVVITSPDPDARRRIVELTRLQLTFGSPVWPQLAHTGMHGGPGTIGRCPIIHAKTSVTHEELPDGVRIHVRANDREMVPLLQQMTELRVRSLSIPTS